MINETRCDHCKQRTNSLFGVANMMICAECHAKLITSTNL